MPLMGNEAALSVQPRPRQTLLPQVSSLPPDSMCRENGRAPQMKQLNTCIIQNMP
jgi:hypothetical protein